MLERFGPNETKRLQRKRNTRATRRDSIHIQLGQNPLKTGTPVEGNPKLRKMTMKITSLHMGQSKK